MENIRLRISVRLNQNHALSEEDLKKLKPHIERGIAACLPEVIFVDTIEVTKIRDADKPVARNRSRVSKSSKARAARATR